ncbi:FAD binding domain-containing protein [Mycena galopus ATCC 62051]|nr:FAD binding domain-containing protein [Mycena galopus ATCC 62051]
MPTSLVRESEVDVLVIGAGPAGLMCANALAKAGVHVRIIDQRSSKVAAGQADGIQPRTIEVFQSYGLAERLLREGNQMHVAAFYNPGKYGGIELTDRVPDVTAPTARYPFEVTLHQGAIENIFLDSMREMGVEVSRPMVPTHLDLDPTKLDDPNAYAARVVLKYLDPLENGPSTEVVRAKFVVGTDGAHSWVRKKLDIAMEGSQTDYVWGVVDMVPQTDFPDIRHKTVIHSENGSCMIIPREGDMVRLYIQLGKDAVDATTGRIDKRRMGPHQLLEVASKSMHPYVFRTPDDFDWWTIYIIGQRVASRFSVDERVFIAGDACHTHSPKAGQGMNASMNDSHNLAWKLAHVLRGWAGLSLLKTYELERRKYAQDLINFDVKFSGLFSGKPRTQINVSGVSHEEVLNAFQTFGGFTSGIGIHYGESAIVRYGNESCARNVVVGQRMPPQVLIRAADGRPVDLQDMLPSNTLFKLLVFTGDTATAKLEDLAADLQEIVHKFATKLELITVVSAAKRPDFCFMDLPPVLRPHWSKVLSDEKDLRGVQGGNAYAAYGIDPRAGAIVCVRPDGYVGMVVPLEKASTIASYFASFMV